MLYSWVRKTSRKRDNFHLLSLEHAKHRERSENLKTFATEGATQTPSTSQQTYRQGWRKRMESSVGMSGRLKIDRRVRHSARWDFFLTHDLWIFFMFFHLWLNNFFIWIFFRYNEAFKTEMLRTTYLFWFHGKISLRWTWIKNKYLWHCHHVLFSIWKIFLRATKQAEGISFSWRKHSIRFFYFKHSTENACPSYFLIFLAHLFCSSPASPTDDVDGRC